MFVVLGFSSAFSVAGNDAGDKRDRAGQDTLCLDVCPLCPGQMGSNRAAESVQAPTAQGEPQQAKGGHKGNRNRAFSQAQPQVCSTNEKMHKAVRRCNSLLHHSL